MQPYVNYYASPIGLLKISSSEKGIVQIDFTKKKPKNIQSTPIIKQCQKELEEYFTKKRKNFTVPLDVSGTVFQKKVWKALTKIPFGTTCSYKDIALKINNPKASRAVGMANNRNKIAIVIPCHRVIGSNGHLVGYAPGISKKKFLLNLEK